VRDGLLQALNDRRVSPHTQPPLPYGHMSLDMAELAITTFTERLERTLEKLYMELNLDDASLRLKGLMNTASLTIRGGTVLNGSQNRRFYCLESPRREVLPRLEQAISEWSEKCETGVVAPTKATYKPEERKLWVTTEHPFLLGLIQERQPQRKAPPGFTR